MQVLPTVTFPIPCCLSGPASSISWNFKLYLILLSLVFHLLPSYIPPKKICSNLLSLVSLVSTTATMSGLISLIPLVQLLPLPLHTLLQQYLASVLLAGLICSLTSLDALLFFFCILCSLSLALPLLYFLWRKFLGLLDLTTSWLHISILKVNFTGHCLISWRYLLILFSFCLRNCIRHVYGLQQFSFPYTFLHYPFFCLNIVFFLVQHSSLP